YVARVRLREPGTYWFMAEPEGGKTAVQALGNVVVSAEDPEPGPGDPAPPSDTPTLASVGGDASRITTRTPPDEILLEHSVAESLRAGVPFVVTFSTPKYCTSRTCGPTVDVVEEVARRFEEREVRFIHVEVYEGNDPAKGFNTWMAEWNLETEPWTFVVGADGKIVERYEGPVSVAELEEALGALLPE
ncbi:MAG: TlpA family protein disulfide reductase, partial [Gaiellaceae bacterium]